VRETTRSSSRSDLFPTMTMGTFSSSLIRIICSRSSASSVRLLRLVMEKTRRKPWPVFMYSSLLIEKGFSALPSERLAGEGLDAYLIAAEIILVIVT
jgi:hypothetical protein